MYREPSQRADEMARRVIGAAIEVHRILGPGFLESVYEAALCIELERRGVPFARQVEVPTNYKGTKVGVARLDLLVDDCLVVELKCVDELAAIHRAQALAYLRATKLELALLINFQTTALKRGVRRVVSTIGDAESDLPS